jgi:hypothetical protein
MIYLLIGKSIIVEVNKSLRKAMSHVRLQICVLLEGISVDIVLPKDIVRIVFLFWIIDII